MIERLMQWWYMRFCKTDIAILWPCCMEQSPSIDDARIVFMYHIEHDWAWRRLSGENRRKLLAQLKEPT